MGASAMEARQTAERSARFIGIIERLEEGWRVSFRLRLPGEVFTQQGETDIFVSEMQATKWLHTQGNRARFLQDGSAQLFVMVDDRLRAALSAPR
jgi:hypothetical protein